MNNAFSLLDPLSRKHQAGFAMTSSVGIGKIQEEAACRFLHQQGLKLLERNYRCGRGEIDLIMQDGNELVFVEVRYRKSDLYGHPLDTINQRKQNRLKYAAEWYIYNHDMNMDCRFDIVAISNVDADAVEWIRNAIYFD